MFECYLDRKFYGFLGDIFLFISLVITAKISYLFNIYTDNLNTDIIISILKDLTVVVIFLTAIIRFIRNLNKMNKKNNKNGK